jgi:FkbM family methyltransferase
MYSQADEEAYILEATRNIIPEFSSGARFLDIGAFHPLDKSNTRALYERGWRGVLIEPSPEPFLSLLKEYGEVPDMQLICAAVTMEPGLVKLHATPDAVSTTSEAEYEKWKEAGGYYGSFLTWGLTLEEISNRFGGFSFINYDAEGSSAELFLHALELGWETTCVCVESDGRSEEIIARATPRGYHVVYGNGTNLVLVRK